MKEGKYRGKGKAYSVRNYMVGEVMNMMEGRKGIRVGMVSEGREVKGKGRGREGHTIRHCMV